MANTIVSKIGKGNVIEYNNEPCFVLERTIHTPPNLASFCTMQVRAIRTGKVSHVRTNVGDNFNVMHKELKKMEFSYEDRGTYAFMDLETYDQLELDAGIVGDAKIFLVPNKEYHILMVEGLPMGIELPMSIEMEVTEAADAIKGDTSGNAQKTVTVETGLEVRTPLFIKTGDIIKVNTTDKTYQGRA